MGSEIRVTFREKARGGLPLTCALRLRLGRVVEGPPWLGRGGKGLRLLAEMIRLLFFIFR